ncbi:MAG: hypothetical protein QM765_29360 [Myxococcales bacterium]
MALSPRSPLLRALLLAPLLATGCWADLLDTGRPCDKDGKCLDGFTCVQNVCVAGGKADTGVAGCFVGGVAYGPGDKATGNECQSCQPAISTTTLTDVADGEVCGNGICTEGLCGDGCGIAGKFYAAGATSPANACQSCQPDLATTQFTDRADGAACSDGQVCSAGKCRPGCFIGGKPYSADALNPNNACQSCQPAKSTTHWSDLDDGVDCGTSKLCAQGSCQGVCVVGSKTWPANSPNPLNACQACLPAQSTDDWSTLADGAPCGSGVLCELGSCVAACYLAGTFFAKDAPNPDNTCQACKPSLSTTAWTNLDGQACGEAGNLCSSGACRPSCLVGGTSYAAGAPNPANPCEPLPARGLDHRVPAGLRRHRLRRGQRLRRGCLQGQLLLPRRRPAGRRRGQSRQRLPDLPASSEHARLHQPRRRHGLRGRQAVQQRHLPERLRHRRRHLGAGRAQPGQRLPVVPARALHHRLVALGRRRRGLRRGQRLRGRHLPRRPVLHRRPDAPARRGQVRQPLPRLRALAVGVGLERAARRLDLRLRPSVRRQEVRALVLHRRRDLDGGRGQVRRSLSRLPAGHLHHHLDPGG